MEITVTGGVEQWGGAIVACAFSGTLLGLFAYDILGWWGRLVRDVASRIFRGIPSKGDGRS